MTLEMYSFIDSCKDHHLTIGDVKNLKVGDKLDVVIWHQNFEEEGGFFAIRGKIREDLSLPQRPEQFFKYNHHQLTYLGNMEWDIHFEWGETFTHPIHLDVTCLETNWTWSALEEDGMIHITKEVVKEGERIPLHWRAKHLHWSEFPDDTRVGWRGPIMLWSKLKDMPPVYFERKQ